MKVLVVDDVGYTRHFIVRLLEKFGCEVLSADSGPQALRMLERDLNIDVVLTDLMMRDMDGVELYKGSLRISRVLDGGSAEAPVFFLMTALRPGGNSQQKDLEKLRMAKEIGFIDVLYKPVEPEQLKLAIENVKYARGKKEVDIAGASRRLQDTVDQLISAKDAAAVDTFIESLQKQLERLESASLAMAQSQPA